MAPGWKVEDTELVRIPSTKDGPTRRASPIPSYYKEEVKHRRVIAEGCPINVYTASISPRWAWPYKLMSYYEARPGAAGSCAELIIDSGYTRRGDMDAILTEADRLDADFCIPPDFTPKVDGYDEMEPVDHVAEFIAAFERYQQYQAQHDGFDTDLLVPLHAPVDRHIAQLRHYEPGHVLGYEANPHFDMRSCTLDVIDQCGGVAVGGLKDLPVDERIDILQTVHRDVPHGTHIHALAPGTELPMLKFLRNNPHVVDSIDVSTPERAPANGKLPDATWSQHKHRFPQGDESSTVRAAAANYIALQLSYMLSGLVDDVMFEAMSDVHQKMLDAFGQAQDTAAPDGGEVPDE